MNLSYIVNKTETKDLVYKNLVGNINATSKSTLVNTTDPFILDYIEWSCNHLSNVRIVIETTTKDGLLSIGSVPNVNGSTILSSARPDNILNNYSGIWDILEYNETQNAYKFRWNLKGFEFPKGVHIYIENTGATVQTAAAIIYGREMK